MLAYELFLKNKEYDGEFPKTVKPIKKIFVKNDQIVIDPKTLDDYGKNIISEYRLFQDLLSMPLNTSSFLNLPNKVTGSNSPKPYVELYGTFENKKTGPKISISISGRDKNQFRAIPPPPLVVSESEMSQFIQKMNDQYGSKEIIESIFDSTENKKIAWMRQLEAEFRTKDEWEIILFLRNTNGNLNKIVEGVNSTNRNKTSDVINTLLNNDLIIISKSKKHGPVLEYEYALSTESRQYYFPETFESIGTAKDINEVAKKAYNYYLENKFFISLVNQNIKKDEMRSDIVVHDYQKNITISVEIESAAHVNSHPEQIRFNMIKWKSLGFDECHMWSKNSNINEIKNKLGSEAEKVQTFIV